MLDEAVASFERAVAVDRQHADAAAREVGDQHVAAGLVDDQMAGIRAVARLHVEEVELAGCPVDAEGADGAARLALEFLELVDAVEELPRRIEGEIGGVANAFSDADWRQRAASASKRNA